LIVDRSMWVIPRIVLGVMCSAVVLLEKYPFVTSCTKFAIFTILRWTVIVLSYCTARMVCELMTWTGARDLTWSRSGVMVVVSAFNPGSGRRLETLRPV
jgi:hypothetical protein